MLQKRENKVLAKQNARKSSGLTVEDKKIKNQVLKQRKDKRREQGGNEDEFDHILEKYQNKLLKKIKAEKGEKGSTPFEEVDMD